MNAYRGFAADFERLPRNNAYQATFAIDEKPELLGCDVCSLKTNWPKLSSPRMPLSGNVDGTILCLGEAPGAEEDAVGHAFVGDSGELLQQHIPAKFEHLIAYQN